MNTRGEHGSVPEFQSLVLARGGNGWAAQVERAVGYLAGTWELTIGRTLHGGTSSYVTEVTTGAGQPAVLKICVPDVDVAAQARTLAGADGRGFVRLLAADITRRALLLEPLGATLSQSALSPVEQLRVLAQLLPLAWQVTHSGGVAQDKAAQLIDLITALDDGRHPDVVDVALRCAERRSAAFDPDQSVLVHGDAAAANVLQRSMDEWVFVDPDGFVGDPAYDRGVAVRDWCDELLSAPDARALMRRYCEVLGADPGVTWEWAFVERVSTGLYVQSLGGDGTPHLTSAATLLDDPVAQR